MCYNYQADLVSKPDILQSFKGFPFYTYPFWGYTVLEIACTARESLLHLLSLSFLKLVSGWSETKIVAVRGKWTVKVLWNLDQFLKYLNNFVYKFNCCFYAIPQNSNVLNSTFVKYVDLVMTCAVFNHLFIKISSYYITFLIYI